ncbi:hypothetical protein [Vibrio cholerae]|uniref:hypothetical protein n=1 Tax=Vibrio cholerae TaxID=666 RepID=UPI0021AE8615|nr:hypothetical protein [Vibrio cholerae]
MRITQLQAVWFSDRITQQSRYEMPDGSIEEVYFGLRHDFSSATKFQAEIKEFSNKYPEVLMKKCSLSANSWEIKAENIE